MRKQVLGQIESQCLPDARSLGLRFNVLARYSASEWRRYHLNSTFVADYAGQVANDLNPAHTKIRISHINDL